MCMHFDGKQLEPGSSIFTHVYRNSSAVAFHNGTAAHDKNSSTIQYTSLIPPNCTYGFQFVDRNGGMEPRDLYHGRRPSRFVHEDEPIIVLVFRVLQKQKAIKQYVERTEREAKELEEFNNFCFSKTLAGKIPVPKVGTINYQMVVINPSLILNHTDTDGFFEPGDEFCANPESLRILGLHYQYIETFAVSSDRLIVSVFCTKVEKCSLETTPHSLKLEVLRPSKKKLHSKILQKSTVSTHVIRVFLGSKIPYNKREHANSIYFLGYFHLVGVTSHSVVLEYNF